MRNTFLWTECGPEGAFQLAVGWPRLQQAQARSSLVNIARHGLWATNWLLDGEEVPNEGSL